MKKFADIEVDGAKLEIRRSGQVLDLEPKAIRVMLYLIAHRDRVVTKDELFEKVWGGAEVTDNALTRIIGQLRKALGDDARQARYIETVPTVGYRFIAREEEPKAREERRVPQLAWLGMGLGVAAVTAAIFLMRSTGAPSMEKAEVLQPQLKQVTNTKGLDTGPTISPDGKWLAYSSDRTGQFEIFARPLDSEGNEVQVTRDGGPNLQAAWSPDGKWIAYHCVAKGGVCLVPATGGTVRILHVPGSEPAWSPDSKRIVLRDSPMTSTAPLDLFGLFPRGLVVVDVETGKLQRLRTAGLNCNVPAWSPDGRWILYSVGPDLQADRIEAMEVATGKRHTVVETVGLTSSMTLTAEQNRLYFTQYLRAEDTGIFQVELEPNTMQAKGKVKEFLRMPALPSMLAMGKEGRSLFVAAVQQDSNLYRMALRNDGSAVGEPEPITSNRNHRNTQPRISPSGTKVAYSARQLGRPAQTWIMNIEGGEGEQISDPNVTTIFPMWTKHGDAVLSRKQAMGLEKVDVASKTRQLIPVETKRTDQYVYSGQGNLLLVSRYREGKIEMFLQDFVTGKRRELMAGKPGIAYPSISPDGAKVAAERFTEGFTYLVVFDLDGKNFREWKSDMQQAWVYDWSPDSKKVSVAGLRGGSWNLYAVNIETGEEKRLTDFRSFRFFVRYPAWSPKSNWIVFEKTEITGNLYEIELAVN